MAAQQPLVPRTGPLQDRLRCPEARLSRRRVRPRDRVVEPLRCELGVMPQNRSIGQTFVEMGIGFAIRPRESAAYSLYHKSLLGLKTSCANQCGKP